MKHVFELKSKGNHLKLKQLEFGFFLHRNIADCWQTIGQDPHLTASVIEQLLELLSRSLPYEEKRDGRDETVVRTAMLTPLAVRT